ncbi:hypothetical protein FB567DRAFT_599698 [Paraphoma chrysanthemicola]|uniref:F-box domain-containing protein n=1 Tax=Paraphoma chrysanthemicola TaxID=798071 RepID=A0A8K0QR77_9PLEO|nr:hypothetical protein FB567DRAFT_599698 [Paraphoma chrysanthemicola]
MHSLSQAVASVMGRVARTFIGAVIRNPDQQQPPLSASRPSDDRPTLMFLPIEIRIMIAKYVVTSPDVLYFQWTTWENHRRAATFEQIKQLSALSQVNRQLHTETSSLVWKMNEFQIQEAYFGTAYICGQRSLAPSDASAIIKALDFLIEHGPVEQMSESEGTTFAHDDYRYEVDRSPHFASAYCDSAIHKLRYKLASGGR